MWAKPFVAWALKLRLTDFGHCTSTCTPLINSEIVSRYKNNMAKDDKDISFLCLTSLKGTSEFWFLVVSWVILSITSTVGNTVI